MSTDYSKKKVAELEEILRSRSLPHTGKKADLIARIQQHDAQSSSTTAVQPAQTGKADPLEDQIDWEDDAAETPSTIKGSAPPAAAAIAAGGKGQVANPPAVPNQVVDTDPSKTSDLKVKPADTSKTTASTSATAAGDAPVAADNTEAEKAPPTDFTSGIATSTIDEELEKRKKRAARFGLQESTDDAAKSLERAKRFGTGSEGDKTAVKGLDEALPERAKRGRGMKRGRDEEKDGGGEGGGKRRATPKPTQEAKVEVSDEVKQRREKDKVAAEARKKRFAEAAA